MRTTMCSMGTMRLPRTSAAKGDFRSKGTRDGLELCNILNAVLGLNGDFVNGTEKLDFGYVVRQGVLFRDNLDTAGRWNSHLMDVLAIDEDGDELEFRLYPIGENEFGRKGGMLKLSFADGCLMMDDTICKKL